jgi:hypothetical protein
MLSTPRCLLAEGPLDKVSTRDDEDDIAAKEFVRSKKEKQEVASVEVHVGVSVSIDKLAWSVRSSKSNF